MNLLGERICLRPVEREDIDLFLRWLNDPEICRFLLLHRPLNRAEEEEFLQNIHKREHDVFFVIALKEGGRPIGSCSMHGFGLPNRSAELGIQIGEKEYWSRGFGREAMELLCGYGFGVLNLNRIGLSVYEYNARGIRCYEKVGFRLEGRRRQARFWDGKYFDVLEYGLLASEWNGRQDAGESGRRELCQAAD